MNDTNTIPTRRRAGDPGGGPTHRTAGSGWGPGASGAPRGRRGPEDRHGSQGPAARSRGRHDPSPPATLLPTRSPPTHSHTHTSHSHGPRVSGRRENKEFGPWGGGPSPGRGPRGAGGLLTGEDAGPHAAGPHATGPWLRPGRGAGGGEARAGLGPSPPGLAHSPSPRRGGGAALGG